MTTPGAVPIAALDDPRVADYRNLKDGELRRERGIFMVEGRFNVEALLQQSHFRTRSVFVTPTALDAMRTLWPALAADTPLYVGEQALFNEIVGFDLHRGCLAVGCRRDERGVADLLAASTPQAPIVALEDLTDIENAGSVFRNALSLGASGVLLSPRCCDPLYRKAVRVSMGAVLRLPYARAHEWPDDLRALRAAGHRLVALDPGAQSQEIADFAQSAHGERLVLVAGTEGAGVSEDVLALADARVRIAMAPEVDSINVATALAIALHRLAVPSAGAAGSAGPVLGNVS